MKNPPYSLSFEAYNNRVLAGWLGKSIGGVIGFRLENHKELKSLTLDQLWPSELAPNDDMDIQLVWLEALQERGMWLESSDLVELWQDRCSYNFCEYGHFLYNVQRGIHPPLSGHWNNRFFRESEGCPIRSEIWGFVCAGNPELAANFACMDATLDHSGESVFIEQFLAAAMAHAMVDHRLEPVLAAGLSVIPPECEAAKAVHIVKHVCRTYLEYRQAWRIIIREYGDRDASKAITNHALVLMALFLGKGDFAQSMLICANSGWDTDCTAATVGALLGAMGGAGALPSEWVENLTPHIICGIQANHLGCTYQDLTSDTCLVGLEMSLTRNPQIEFIGAPEVRIRHAPAATPIISVEYLDQPVLWQSRETCLRVIFRNPTAESLEGPLQFSARSELNLVPSESTLLVEPRGSQEIFLSLSRSSADGWIADKNMIDVSWIHGNGSTTFSFGLGGARQWLVYGPYWDMWDRSVNAICPFSNDWTQSHPIFAGYPQDSYNHHCDLNRPYLDEATLLKQDIPAELPLILEHGEDDFGEDELGGFRGQACYYLVRTIRSQEEIDVVLCIGSDGPVKAWLDGREVLISQTRRSWDVHGTGSFKLRLNGGKQRLVIKAMRLADYFRISAVFQKSPQAGLKEGVSYIYDGLENRIEDIGEPRAGANLF